jgi:hypothetical protein
VVVLLIEPAWLRPNSFMPPPQQRKDDRHPGRGQAHARERDEAEPASFDQPEEPILLV